jgi:hypothetical protein
MTQSSSSASRSAGVRVRDEAGQGIRLRAADDVAQVGQVHEVVGLAAQVVAGHRRLALHRRDHGDAAALALHGLDQGAEVAVAREQHQVIDGLGHLQHVDGDLDVHVAAPALAALAVGELAGRLGHQGEAVVVQPVDQRPDRGILVVLGDGGVVIGAHQDAALFELVQQLAVVDVEAQGLGGGIEIGPVNEQRQALGRVEGHVIGNP